MKSIWVALCSIGLLLFASPSFAGFTTAEKDELEKVVLAGVHAARAVEDIGFAVDDLPLSNKTVVSNAVKELFDAQFLVRAALSFAFSSESSSSLTRAQEVASLKSSVDNAVADLNAAKTLLQSLPSNPDINAAIARINLALDVNTFDDTLGYESFQPPSYPRVVGPHGDFDRSQASLEHMTQYSLHCLWDAVRFWQNTSVGMAPSMGLFFRNNGKALDLMFRAWGLDAEIVTSLDEPKILQDEAAGSGLRPFSFFRLLREVELVASQGGTAFSGRNFELGATAFVRSFSDNFTTVVKDLASSNSADLQAQWTGRRGAISNNGTTGWATEFFHDLNDFWTDLDGTLANWMLFFHEIPAPPGGGGSAITCGAGTHLEGNACVADACPTPEAEAVITIIDNDTIQVDCVIP